MKKMSEPCPHTVIYARHAIFEKEGFTGQIGLACTPVHNFVAIDDPRTKGKLTKRFATRAEAEKIFEEYVIATVTDNGWKMIYNGRGNIS